MKRKRINCQGFKFVIYSVRQNRHILHAWDPCGTHYTFDRTVSNKDKACVEMGALIHHLKVDPGTTPNDWTIGKVHQDRVTVTVTFEKEKGESIAVVCDKAGSNGFLVGAAANQVQRVLGLALRESS